MTNFQYLFSLSVHYVLRALRIEGAVINFARRRAARYLRRQGLGSLLDRDLSYGMPILDLPDRRKVIDLARLHKLVSSGRYRSIREYGAGTSTFVMAHAASTCAHPIDILAIEESSDWIALITSELGDMARRVRFMHSRYASVSQQGAAETDLQLTEAAPGVPDFIYVDGPSLVAASRPIRGIPLTDGWAEPINVDFQSAAHGMRKGALILFDDRTASYWALLRALRRPYVAWSSPLFDSNRVVLL